MIAHASRELEAWRATARRMLAAGADPASISWQCDASAQPSLGLDGAAPGAQPGAERLARVPRAFIDLARDVLCHRDDAVFAALYSALWRIAHGERELLSVASDPLVRLLETCARDVRRDLHKMKAFVRFREIRDHERAHFVAWFEPQHHIVRAVAPFFRDRFASMDWTILTPDLCVTWTGAELVFSKGVDKPATLEPDRLDALWRAYYASIFNPARLNVAQMRKEMPVRYWRNLPEAALIAPLVARSGEQVAAMIERQRTPAPSPAQAARPSDDASLEERLSRCTACDLYARATQAVAGTGDRSARIMIVGEQPGDEEDLAGEPFVGPAGKVLRRALADAQLEASSVYLTNAVKHFSWFARGKRRMHKTPAQREIEACRPWLLEELDSIRPRIVVCLGRSAMRAIFPAELAQAPRGEPIRMSSGVLLMHTYHPAFVLRSEPDAQESIYRALVEALKRAAEAAPEPA